MSETNLPAFFTLQERAAVGSTNDEVRAAAEAGASEGLLIRADEQTGGRGRRGRAWHSPAGNLYVSLLLHPGPDLATAAQLSFACALAVHDALAPLLPKEALSLKWPNDVLVNGRKVAGILLESGRLGDNRPYVIAGIGINLRHAPARTDGLAAIALAELIEPPAPKDALVPLARALHRWLMAWRADGFAPLREGWRTRSGSLGRRLRVQLPDESFEGVAEDLDSAGVLLVRCDDGTLRRVSSGEVFALPGDGGTSTAGGR